MTNSGIDADNLVPNTQVVNNAFDLYQASGFKNQDKAHNPILEGLLNNEYGNDTNTAAIEALRGGKLNHPLHWLQNPGDENSLRSNELFIRDYCQYRGPGGDSEYNHYTIGTEVTSPKLKIEDKILDNSFSKIFNKYVLEINKKIKLINDHIWDPNKKHSYVREFKGVAHRDAIQLIPHDKGTDLDADGIYSDNEQDIGEIMSNVTVQNTHIFSEGQLQGIFASDGAFKNLHILNNNVNTKGAHHITISGFLDGKIDGNDVNNGEIRLEPLRINGDNIYILGFDITSSENGYQYDLNIEGSDYYIDYREIPRKPNGRYWSNVNMKLLQENYRDVKRLVVNILENDTLTYEEKVKETNKHWETLRDLCGATNIDPYQGYKDLFENRESLSPNQYESVLNSFEGIAEEELLTKDFEIFESTFSSTSESITIPEKSSKQELSNELEAYIDSLGLSHFKGSEFTPYWKNTRKGIKNSVPPRYYGVILRK